MLITTLACPNYFVLEIELALLLYALAYIITEQTRCIRANFAALANSALRRVSDCDQEIRKCPRSSRSLLFLFYARSSARDVYTKCRCACVEYRAYSLFASSIPTVPENTGVNQRDWKHNPEIIARYVKVHATTFYLTFTLQTYFSTIFNFKNKHNLLIYLEKPFDLNLLAIHQSSFYVLINIIKYYKYYYPTYLYNANISVGFLMM